MYAELSSRYPCNGSAFAFCYSVHGELPAFLVGWNLNLRYGVSAAALARGMAAYLVGLLQKFNLNVSNSLLTTKIGPIQNCCPLAPLLIIILASIVLLGSRESNFFNLILTTGKLVTLSIIIVVAFSEYEPSNMDPFFSTTTAT